MRVIHVLFLSVLLVGCNRPESAGGANDAKPVADAQPAGSGLVELTPEQIRAPVLSTTCNLEQIGSVVVPDPQPVAVESRSFAIAGWIFDEAAQAPVSGLQVRVTARPDGKSWQQAIATGLERPDVQVAYNGDAKLLNTGFAAALDTSALPPGEYGLVLFYQRDGQDVACDNGRGVVLK